MLSHFEARQKVVEVVGRLLPHAPRKTEALDLRATLGRVLATEIRAERDYPPFHRATRDGFAVRAADCAAVPVTLDLVGEIRAGAAFAGHVAAGQCAQIMTGAALPPGADAVVMIEHTKPSKAQVVIEKAAERGQNIVARGSEAQAGQALLQPGTRMGYAEMAMAAQVGQAQVEVSRRPQVAILSTGDEVVELGQQPGPFQIRNSNNVSLAAQVELAGGAAVSLGNAPDRIQELRAMVERGLEEDALLLSGGVSMGKYDFVETVLRELGAEFHFNAVAIRPGRPAVFSICRGKPVFGLPGNPVSTMVTFELLVAPALDLLSGAPARPLPLLRAKLARATRQKAALTHFLPARITWESGDAVVEELPWQGSGDIVALAAANCFLVVHAARPEMAAGEWADVLPRRGQL